MSCSEEFYKQQINKHLPLVEGSDKQKVMEMLKRAEEVYEGSGSECDEDDIEEWFNSLDLNNKNIEEWWDLLTEEEKIIFANEMQSGAPSFLEEWKPWWTIVPVPESKIEKTTIEHEKIPKRDIKLTPFEQLTSRKPKINDRYAYAYIKRLYNGEYENEEMAEGILQLSVVLGTSKVFAYESVHDAFEHCIYSSNNNPEYKVSNVVSQNTITHVMKLLSHPDFVIASLKDLYGILEDAKLRKEGRRTALLALRKLEFYLSFMNTLDFFEFSKHLRDLQRSHKTKEEIAL
ncbi:hypothetical protein ROZALSC1DRAFT_29270 [Rozella allomycis CSF55]|uniref:Uncharacterized protein n=1 Tax=Rozella allomycis (strain CSF55) TaxID=988480 RepID=A0A4P9YI82_ROZAC|nr:hypothetical protein ROZALSC1DRAFT_29270 [Rozella allomycis CSF55]